MKKNNPSLVQDTKPGRAVKGDAKESKDWQGLHQSSWSSLQGICLGRLAGNVICLIRIKWVFLRSPGKGQRGGGSSVRADSRTRSGSLAPKGKKGRAGMGLAAREYPTGNPPLSWTSPPEVMNTEPKRQHQIPSPRRAFKGEIQCCKARKCSQKEIAWNGSAGRVFRDSSPAGNLGYSFATVMSLKCTGKSGKCPTHWTNILKTAKPQFLTGWLHSRRNSTLHLLMKTTERKKTEELQLLKENADFYHPTSSYVLSHALTTENSKYPEVNRRHLKPFSLLSQELSFFFQINQKDANPQGRFPLSSYFLLFIFNSAFQVAFGIVASNIHYPSSLKVRRKLFSTLIYHSWLKFLQRQRVDNQRGLLNKLNAGMHFEITQKSIPWGKAGVKCIIIFLKIT